MTSNEIIVGIAIGVASTILASIITFFFKPDIYHNISCRLKASRIKRHKGRLIGVLVCKFEGDRRSKLSNLVRLNIRNNYIDGNKGVEKLAVYSFPLSLSSVSDDDEQNKNEATALRWLESSDCDYIVWGERIEVADQLVVKIMGRFSSATKPTTLVAYGSTSDFDQLLGEAITRELIAASTGAFKHPERCDLYSLMLIVDRTELLLTSNMDRFESNTSLAIRHEIDCLVSEVCRRVPRAKFLNYAVTNAKKIFQTLNDDSETSDRVVAARICANHMVGRAVVGVDINELGSFISFIEEAILVLKSSIQAEDKITLEMLHEWLLALQKRDVGIEQRTSDFASVLSMHSHLTDEVAKTTSLAYLVSVYPIEYMNLRGISLSSPRWPELAWKEIEPYIKSSVFAFMTIDIIVSESHSRALYQADEALFVEILKWLEQEIDRDSDELQRLCFLSSYAELSASAIRTFGLHFFSKNFPRVEIIKKLDEICESLLRYATIFKGATSIEYDLVKAAASTYASIASSTAYSGNFLRADLYYQLAQSLITVQGSPGWVNLLRERCVNLNNWAQHTRDLRWADLCLSLLKQMPDDDIFSLYLRGFAHYTRAIIVRDRSSDMGPNFKCVWLGDAKMALDLCIECAEKFEAVQHPDAKSPRRLIAQIAKGFPDLNLDKFVKKV